MTLVAQGLRAKDLAARRPMSVQQDGTKQVWQEALTGWPCYTGAQMSHAIKHNAIDLEDEF